MPADPTQPPPDETVSAEDRTNLAEDRTLLADEGSFSVMALAISAGAGAPTGAIWWLA